MVITDYTNPTPLPDLPSGWSVKVIEDLCIKVTSGGTPLRSHKSFYKDGNYYWYRTQELKDCYLYDSEEKITQEALDNSSAKLFPKDTVLMAMYGDGKTITSLGILANEAATNQACCAMIPNQDLCDPPFLFYALKYHRLDFLRLASGGAQRNLSGKIIRRFAINTPNLKEQRTIAKILRTIDSKIELNRKMSQTLYKMARVIFKSWFVDFDPVRAKADARDPRLPLDLSTLFPESLGDSELGEIPKGWRKGSVGELISQKTDRVGDGQAIVLSAVAASELVRSDEHFTKRVYSKEIGKYLVVEQWDFAYNPSRINIGSIGMLKEAMIGAVSPVYVVFRPKPGFRWFIEFMFRQPDTKQWINSLASGSVRQSLSYRDLASIPCVIPPVEMIQKFDQIWTSLRDGILAHTSESRTLAALRDTLLPKLLSGELRVNITAQDKA